MPNLLDASGLQTYTYDELVTIFTTRLKAIYGDDINLASDTPDGQMMNIFIQIILDTLDLVKQVYNTFNPDNAIGNILDQRVAINGIQRQGGTYSQTPITVVTSSSVTLYGLDQEVEPVYTVSDSNGNEFQLIDTIAIPVAGSNVLLFQAALPGQVLTIPNTITRPVTIVLGVDSVNNPSAQTIIGLDEETDAALKIRRQQSVTISSQGFTEGLLAALKNVTGVVDAFVHENTTDTTDGDGTPGHTLWAIVSGSYANADVATAIYRKRNAGCGMRGAKTYLVTQVDGTTFIVKWDDVAPVELFIKFTVTSIDGLSLVDYDAIRNGLPNIFIPGVYKSVNVNELSTLVQSLDDNALVTNAGFCLTLTGSYVSLLSPSTKKDQFVVVSPKVIILPILPNTLSTTATHSQELTFTAKGGYGAYTWTIPVNNSGGSIVSGTGVYTAGASNGTDTVRVTDANSNYTDITVVVS